MGRSGQGRACRCRKPGSSIARGAEFEKVQHNFVRSARLKHERRSCCTEEQSGCFPLVERLTYLAKLPARLLRPFGD